MRLMAGLFEGRCNCCCAIMSGGGDGLSKAYGVQGQLSAEQDALDRWAHMASVSQLSQCAVVTALTAEHTAPLALACHGHLYGQRI